MFDETINHQHFERKGRNIIKIVMRSRSIFNLLLKFLNKINKLRFIEYSPLRSSDYKKQFNIQSKTEEVFATIY